MGSERASTVRQRRAGKICVHCSKPISDPYTGRETLCPPCHAERTKKKRIYMHFMCRDGWYCQFLEEDLKTSLPKKLLLRDSSKIIQMAAKGGYNLNLEGRQSLDHAISNGRGGIWLHLTEEQYAKLQKR